MLPALRTKIFICTFVKVPYVMLWQLLLSILIISFLNIRQIASDQLPSSISLCILPIISPISLFLLSRMLFEPNDSVSFLKCIDWLFQPLGIWLRLIHPRYFSWDPSTSIFASTFKCRDFDCLTSFFQTFQPFTCYSDRL